MKNAQIRKMILEVMKVYGSIKEGRHAIDRWFLVFREQQNRHQR
jgi:hypothetical protein